MSKPKQARSVARLAAVQALYQMEVSGVGVEAVIREFADGLAEVFVVEDKNPTLETRVMEALYALAARPMVSGKRTPDGALLLPSTGSLTADVILPHLRSRLAQRLAPERLAPLPAPVGERAGREQLVGGT